MYFWFFVCTLLFNFLIFLLPHTLELNVISVVGCSMLLLYNSDVRQSIAVGKESKQEVNKEEAPKENKNSKCDVSFFSVHNNVNATSLTSVNDMNDGKEKEKTSIFHQVDSRANNFPPQFFPAHSVTQKSDSIEGKKKQIVCIGAGNWGTTVARLVSLNVPNADFEHRIILQIHDEFIEHEERMMLSEIINTKHENVKYLPGIRLPDNIVAEPNMELALQNADIVVFGVPDQFVRSVANSMKNKVKKGAWLVTLTKGLEFENNKLKPITHILSEVLSKSLEEICVLSGANLAYEVSNDEFSEATLACKSPKILNSLIPLFNRSTFRVSGITNVEGPQMCGALKNVMALGKGILDGLKNNKKIKFGMNSQAAFIRIALKEISKFNGIFFEIPESVYFESCCIADLITSCAGGRHRKTAEQFAFHDGNISFEVLEKQILNGQKLQGTYVIFQIYKILEKHSISNEFPLMSAVYKTIYENAKPETVYEAMTVV